jgi:DNA helicase II / ATP-dependent DNA helicase PcrA
MTRKEYVKSALTAEASFCRSTLTQSRMMLTNAEALRIRNQLRLFEAARPYLPREPTPHYLAHVALQSRGRRTDVLLTTLVRSHSIGIAGGDLLLVDWQTSPLAELFFSHAEGKRYRIVTRGEAHSGKVIERNLVGFQGDQLVELTTKGAVFSRRGTEAWQKSKATNVKLVPRPEHQRKRATALVDVTLDPAQLGIVRLPPGTPLLVLGEAGHGKTTVALHRLAHLLNAEPAPERAAVIVPAEGLRQLIEPLMRRLGVDVEVRIYDGFARRQARRVFRDTPRRESRDTTAGTVRLKRSRALGAALDVIAGLKPARVDDDVDARERRTHAHVRHADLQALFGDRALLELVSAAAPQPFPEHVIRETLEHTRIQFARSTEHEFRHVEASKRAAVDGQELDEGTPMQDAGSIDAEDHAVLFEIDRRRAERRRLTPTAPPRYDCIVLDEAQEFAAFELALIGRSLADGGSLIVAGDADQQLDPGADFESWERTMEALGVKAYERRVLGVGYRCPPPVAALARSLLDENHAATTVAEIRGLSFTTEAHLIVWLIAALRELEKHDRTASVAVICRMAATAQRLSRLLRFALENRLVLDGNFAHHAATNVTTVDQVKGLEFDFVIVPDATPANYPDTRPARRALYVAVTRARHQLVLCGVGGLTPLTRPLRHA